MTTRWSDHDRAIALAMLANGTTLADTHAKLGPSISTLSRWAKTAGIDVVQRRIDKTREATAASLASRDARRAARIDALEALADICIEAETAMAANGELRDVVGCRTRAIHDAELLAGRATSRTDTVTALDDEIAALTQALAANDQPVDA